MTDMSTTETETDAQTSAKSMKGNNGTYHLKAAITATTTTTTATTTTATDFLTNGSAKATKRNNKQIRMSEQDLVIAAHKTGITMSTVGFKSPTPSTQSPATTPSQTIVSYDTNTSACSTTLISSVNQSSQGTTKPAFQSNKDIITSETIAAVSSTKSSPTIAQGGNSSSSNNMTGITTTISSTNSRSSPPIKSVAKQEREATAQDVDEVARLFEEKPEAFEKWLTERAPPEALSRLHEFIESRKQPLKRSSVTSDLFQQWMSSSPVQVS